MWKNTLILTKCMKNKKVQKKIKKNKNKTETSSTIELLDFTSYFGFDRSKQFLTSFLLTNSLD